MNVFDLRDRLVSDYQNYTASFIKIRDPRINEHVNHALGAGAFWPEPLLQLNPTFLAGDTIDDLTAAETLLPVDIPGAYVLLPGPGNGRAP